MDLQPFEQENVKYNYDKKIINEGKLIFTNNLLQDKQTFNLTDDGMVEHYIGAKLEKTFPFSKLALLRECKLLIQEGFENINSNNIETDDIITNSEEVKQNLQQDIKNVEEIQNLKDELDDKVANLMEESIRPTEKFPSTDFSSEPVLYQYLDVETFNKELTAEQKAYINTYLGTIEEFVDAMLLLYNEVGDGISPMISIDDYVEELLNDNSITEWSQELADMLGFDLKTENKSKFNTPAKVFDEFLEKAQEEYDEDGYTFKLSDLGLTREDSAEFKNLLLQKDEIEDIQYNPQNNTYTVKLVNTDNTEKSVDNTEESVDNVDNVDNVDKSVDKVEECVKPNEEKLNEANNISRLYQHTKDKNTFAIIGSQDQDTKQDRSNELKTEIGKAQRQYKNVGYNKLEGTYTYETGEQGIENSFIIYNIPKEKALEIANNLNQESIIWKDENYFGFLRADGTEDGQFKNQEKKYDF